MEDKEQRIKIQFDTNADETKKKVDGVTDSLDKNKKGTDNVTESQKKTGKSTKDLAKDLEGLDNPISNAISGFKGFIKQMWALVANPVGLVLAAIAGALLLVGKYFTNTFAGGEKLQQVMSGISAAGQALIDNLDKIGSAIVKVFTLDFSGAKKEINDVVSSAQGAFNKMAALKKQSQQLERDQADNDLDAIKRRATLADLKDKLLDDSVSYKEKKKIQSDLLKASEENAKSDIELARKIAANKIEALELEKDGAKKNYVEIQKIKGDQLRGEIENSQELKQIRRSGATLDREEQARIKEITAAKAAAYKERLAAQKEAAKLAKESLDKENEAYFKKVVEDAKKAEEELNTAKKIGLDFDKQLADEKEKLRQEEVEAEVRKGKALEEEAKRQAEIDKALLKQKEEIEAKKFEIAEKGVQLLAGIFGKSKKVQKAAMIADGAISIGKQVAANNAANIGALATPQAIATSGAAAAPVIALNNISTGIGIASTIASTAKALQSLGGGSAPSATGGSQVQGGGGVTSATPQVSFQASRENQIATSVSKNNANQPPIQAFVVGKQVTTQQNLDNNKIKSNSI